MKGLECSEVLFSSINKGTTDCRIDSEYYAKNYLEYEEIISKRNNVELSKVANFLIGPFGSAFDTSNYVENGKFRYVRGQDVKPFVLKSDDNRYIPKKDFDRLKRYSLLENDVLVSVVGTLGNVCLVRKKDVPAIFSCKSSVIRTNNINPIYLLTFLNSKYGRTLLLRKARGAIQQGVNLDDLKSICVPVVSDKFSNLIVELFQNAQDNLEQSQSVYHSAEHLLLKSLGLENWQPKNEKTTVKKFSDYEKSGRLDAEYYQPKYEELEKKIKNYKNGYDQLGEIALLKRGSLISDVYYTEQSTMIPYIRGADISSNFLSDDKLIYIDKKFAYTNETKCCYNDIIFSMIGSVGTLARATKEFDGAFISNNLGLIRVHDKNYLPEFLHLYLCTKNLGNMFFEKKEMRTAQPKISDRDLLDFVIPRLDKSIQKDIADKVQESFRLRQQSKELLERAKRAVEMAIEQGEDKAMEWLKNCDD